MITHSPIMQYVSEQHLIKFEGYFQKRLIGDQDWHQNYNFPFAGILFSRFHFQKQEFFGNAFALSPYYSFSLLRSERWKVQLRTTVGVGYIEKSFDIAENYKNVAIGSSFNLYFGLQLQTEYWINKQWALLLGTDFSHFSNTGAVQPNMGINLPNLEFGLIHQFGESTDPKRSDSRLEFKPSNHWQLRYGVGLNQTYPVNGPNFLASAFSVEWEHRLNRRSSFGSALDLFYNPVQKVNLARDSVEIDGGWQNLQMGLSFHYLQTFGKFKSGVKAGFYVKKEDPELDFLYTEVYGQHLLIGDLDAFISLKTHLTRAEYLLIGIKYAL